MNVFELMSEEDVKRSEELANDPAEKRRYANLRCHCTCGRFTKPARCVRDDLVVDCSRCGSVIL